MKMVRISSSNNTHTCDGMVIIHPSIGVTQCGDEGDRAGVSESAQGSVCLCVDLFSWLTSGIEMLHAFAKSRTPVVLCPMSVIEQCCFVWCIETLSLGCDSAVAHFRCSL